MPDSSKPVESKEYDTDSNPDSDFDSVSESTEPFPPTPSYQTTEFIAWLKKRGAIRKLSECMRKWESEGLDIEYTVNSLSPEIIAIYRSRGEKVVFLKNKVWADRWMIFHDLEVPHHKHKKKI
ncbi:hypothetical protein MSMTP_2090 [Methanosarcina sp. MTP4]|uniref:hypothetical protein n=1 Tax=Methanosarcina sp. MTP4 TaxID=1434100 RepID=UPI000615A040|nr:hypothetical protein [Methanosarcina sp. MTP4]AKB25559.1 hypothetical protein MSMTP_2090 [Methanosarcina sp. MTP4]